MFLVSIDLHRSDLDHDRRNPLARAVSVYYFWGELSNKGSRNPFSTSENQNRLPKHLGIDQKSQLQSPTAQPRPKPPLGKGQFAYHGDEQTIPPLDIALSYSSHLPYHPGMPGPSYSWSCYANSVDDAIRGLQEMSSVSVSGSGITKDEYRMAPVILERLDESLIVLCHHLKWSIADVINVVSRKVSSLLIFIHYSSSLFLLERLCHLILITLSGQLKPSLS
jgi:hypothetical protein